MVVHAVCDFETGTMGFPFVEDKKEKLEECQAIIDKWCPLFTKMVVDNAQPPFIVGAGMTVADIRLAEVLTGYLELLPECLDAYPELLALQRNVTASATISAYLESDQRWKFP